MLSRRNFLLSGTSAVALTGCASINTQVPIWVAGLQAIASEISLVMPQLTAAGLSGATSTTANAILLDIKSALAAINSASSVSQGQSVLATIESYINSLAPLVLPFVSLIPGGSIVGLIVAALPAIELGVNFLTSLLSPIALQVAATAPPLPAAGRLGGTLDPNISQAYLNLIISRASGRFMSHYRRRIQ